jgi:hypothetical protein
MSLGDRVTVAVEVSHRVSDAVTWPALSDTLGSFEVVEIREDEPVVAEERLLSTRRFVFTTFELGETEIPPIEVTVEDTSSGEIQVLSTEPISLSVESVGIDESGDIRTVKQPLEIPRNWLLLLPWVILVVGLAALSYWLYWRYRSREKSPDERSSPALPPRPPHEVAYEALERLEAKRLLERGEIKQYFIEVSEIIRTYLEGRYPIDAMEMTSYEVLQELKRVGIDPEVLDLFQPFFNRADLVKFAKHRPGPDVAKEMIPMARLLIDETRSPDHVQDSNSTVRRDESTVEEEQMEVI